MQDFELQALAIEPTSIALIRFRHRMTEEMAQHMRDQWEDFVLWHNQEAPPLVMTDDTIDLDLMNEAQLDRLGLMRKPEVKASSADVA